MNFTWDEGETNWGKVMTQLRLDVLNVENQPEEKKDGCAVADAIYVVVVIHVGFDGVDEARVKLLSLVEDEEGLRATQHHVPDGLSQLALDSRKVQNTLLK